MKMSRVRFSELAKFYFLLLWMKSYSQKLLVSIFLFVCFIQCFRASYVLAEPSNIFQVGLVLPLTGPAADYGVAIKNCIDLAIKDRPELFTNIKFNYEDAAYDRL